MAPIVAHVLCNIMGLPALGDVFSSSHTKGFAKHILYMAWVFLISGSSTYGLLWFLQGMHEVTCLGPIVGSHKIWVSRDHHLL